MADEAGQEATLVAPTATEILSSEGKTDVAERGESLFGETVPSDDELRGIDASNESETTKESATSQPETQKEDAKTEESAVEEKKKPDPPPSGYVPKQALDEERAKRKEEASQRQQLQGLLETYQKQLDMLMTMQSRKEDTKEQQAPQVKFRELSPDEFRSLKETDVDAALEYLKDLSDYKAEQAVERVKLESTKAMTEAQAQQQRQAFIDEVKASRAEMEKEVPGLFDDDSPVNGNLIQFAEENGMPREYLVLFSDPGSTITTSDGKNTFVVGKGAAGLVKMLYALYNKGPQLETEITNKVTKELAGKLKSNDGFKSIGDASKGRDEAASGKVWTEADFYKMSAEDQRRYLGG